MAGLNWIFEQLVDYYSHDPEPPSHLNPLIKQLLTSCPNSSVFNIGGHSVVLRLAPDIVAKVSLEPGDERLRQEQKIFEVLGEAPHIVQCHLSAPDVSFLELVRNGTLYDRMSMTKPRPPIVHWMLQLSHAAASLETLGYAHSDINPQNILFDDDDQVKLIDFDHSLKVGEHLDVGYEPYVRQHREITGGQYGVAGAATEQFALGSVFWYMSRGSHAYSELEGHDRVNRLLDGIFPATDPQDPIDCIIRNCWHGHYLTVADLVDDIQRLSEFTIQTGHAPSQRQEQRLRCEEYCAMANLVPAQRDT